MLIAMWETRHQGDLNSTKDSSLNFRKFSVANGTEFIGIFLETRRTSHGIPEFLKISYREFPFYYIFLPRFLESWLNFWNLTVFRMFWKLSQEISYICPNFESWIIFWLNGFSTRSVHSENASNVFRLHYTLESIRNHWSFGLCVWEKSYNYR